MAGRNPSAGKTWEGTCSGIFEGGADSKLIAVRATDDKLPELKSMRHGIDPTVWCPTATYSGSK